MDAINFLKLEHQRVRDTMSEINQMNQHETKIKMFEILGSDLICHEKMEHAIWYPHFENNKKRLKETVRHLLKEENYAEKEIKYLELTEGDLDWDEKFARFKQKIELHAKEEETDLFPEIKKILTKEQLEKIGEEMRLFKDNYQTKHS